MKECVLSEDADHRCLAELSDEGDLILSNQYHDEDRPKDEWTSWQDEGITLLPEELDVLIKWLTEMRDAK